MVGIFCFSPGIFTSVWAQIKMMLLSSVPVTTNRFGLNTLTLLVYLKMTEVRGNWFFGVPKRATKYQRFTPDKLRTVCVEYVSILFYTVSTSERYSDLHVSNRNIVCELVTQSQKRAETIATKIN